MKNQPRLSQLFQARTGAAIRAGGSAMREKPKKCTHPPERLYSWFARDDTADSGQVLCVGCCDCGKVLKGGIP